VVKILLHRIHKTFIAVKVDLARAGVGVLRTITMGSSPSKNSYALGFEKLRKTRVEQFHDNEVTIPTKTLWEPNGGVFFLIRRMG
jgi:hypothetical protein